MTKVCVNTTTKTVRMSIFASPTWCGADEVYREWSTYPKPGPKGDTARPALRVPPGPPGTGTRRSGRSHRSRGACGG
jgi:hypothetical protein